MRPNQVRFVQSALFYALTVIAAHAFSQAREPVLSLAKKGKPALLETLKGLVSIETGSRDSDCLEKLATLIGRVTQPSKVSARILWISSARPCRSLISPL
jgi:hypothetical protein